MNDAFWGVWLGCNDEMFLGTDYCMRVGMLDRKLLGVLDGMCWRTKNISVITISRTKTTMLAAFFHNLVAIIVAFGVDE